MIHALLLWVATWTASPQSVTLDPTEPLLKIEDQTVRERVRVSTGGEKISVRFSNESSKEPLVIGAATLDTTHAIKFGGQRTVTIPAGAPMVSDPIDIHVDAGSEIAISIYFPKRVADPTLHWLALKKSVISQHGDHTGDTTIDAAASSNASIAISGVYVQAKRRQTTIVAFGDSLTDGDGSTVDADHNWPTDFHRRSHITIVDQGIIGNRLLADGPSFGISALARFDRDALSVPGVTHVVLQEGLNDIGMDDRPPDEIIAAYKQLIERAHGHGLKIIGVTITPCEGTRMKGYYTDEKNATREAVNRWIRTSGAFDGIIDFDAIVRDPEHPARLRPAFASKDHLHPNDTGYQAIADAIDLSLFR
jgi:lysophospholipase L1-like esterase